MDSVYVETTVIGSIAGRLHPDPLVQARQRISRLWWANARTHYRLLVSQLVEDECLAGDPGAAEERLRLIAEIPRLEINDAVSAVAKKLMAHKAIPISEPRDAIHVGLAAAHGIEYLVTWNFKHIANATLRDRINRVCRTSGFEPPTICTPEELAGSSDGTIDAD